MTGTINGTPGPKCMFDDCQGYTNSGFQSAPTIPATATPLTNPFGFNTTVYVSIGTATITGGIQVNGTTVYPSALLTASTVWAVCTTASSG